MLSFPNGPLILFGFLERTRIASYKQLKKTEDELNHCYAEYMDLEGLVPGAVAQVRPAVSVACISCLFREWIKLMVIGSTHL